MHQVTIKKLQEEYKQGLHSIQGLDALDCELLANRIYTKIMGNDREVFFWRHTLAECIRKDLFGKLLVLITAFVGGDIWTRCVFATLAMLQMQDDTNSRIIIGQGRRRDVGFCWAETQVEGVWYALDPSLMHQKQIPLSSTCLEFASKQTGRNPRIYVMDHQDFWTQKIAQRLHYITQSRLTSQLWYELDCESWLIAENVDAFQRVLDTKDKIVDANTSTVYSIATGGEPRFVIDQPVIELCLASKSIEEIVSAVASAHDLADFLKQLGFKSGWN